MLSKWEKYEAHGLNPDGGKWQLVFKLFSFYDPCAPDLSKTEQVRHPSRGLCNLLRWPLSSVARGKQCGFP